MVDPGRADELRRQGRVFLPELVVGGFVKRHAVLHALIPSECRDSVKAVADPGQGLAKSLGLVGRRMELNANSAFHSSYMQYICGNVKKKTRGNQEAALPPPPKGRGLRAED